MEQAYLPAEPVTIRQLDPATLIAYLFSNAAGDVRRSVFLRACGSEAHRFRILSRLQMKLRRKSPWTFGCRLRIFFWQVCWTFFCSWTPKPLNGWRIIWLRFFGAKITGRPFVHQRARIAMPWHVQLDDASCVGDRANLYSVGPIHLGYGCTVAQESYLCTGDHDLSVPEQPLLASPIRIGAHAFLGARTFVLRGITIGEHAVVGAASVVTKDVPPGARVAGNPASRIDLR